MLPVVLVITAEFLRIFFLFLFLCVCGGGGGGVFLLREPIHMQDEETLLQRNSLTF